jgi:hypothetical protein
LHPGVATPKEIKPIEQIQDHERQLRPAWSQVAGDSANTKEWATERKTYHAWSL